MCQARIPNLEKLVLDGCTNLVEIHCSIGFLDKLVYLGLHRCPNLRSFPSRLRLRSLESLDLSGCSKIKNFPEIECQMKCLKYINFEETSIEELPSSIEYLDVKTLNLRFCTNLTKIPNSIHQLQHLKKLSQWLY
jgi:Leucine-rich repeat (LRR) protein